MRRCTSRINYHSVKKHCLCSQRRQIEINGILRYHLPISLHSKCKLQIHFLVCLFFFPPVKFKTFGNNSGLLQCSVQGIKILLSCKFSTSQDYLMVQNDSWSSSHYVYLPISRKKGKKMLLFELLLISRR